MPRGGRTTPEVRSRAAELTLAGRFDESRPLWLRLMTAGPDGQRWAESAIVEAMEWTDLQVATELATMFAAVRWGSAWHPPPSSSPAIQVPAEPPRTTLSAAKLRHDGMQFAHLREMGVLDGSFDGIIDDYERIAARLDGCGPEARAPLEGADRERIGHVYNRIVHVDRADRVARALSSTWRPDAVEEEYLTTPPGLVVVDEFLSVDALSALQAYCRDSTVWTGIRYSDGRLGAFFVDGFAPPVLAQIAEELRLAFPRLIGAHHRLRQLWAYKYSPRVDHPSTLHADFAAININFWITPDAANQEPDGGGLLVYDLEAPPDWDFETYNRRPDLIGRYLDQHAARVRVIPHRANRAVIFNSDLFHATAPISFRPGLANQRINITLLYGERAPSHRTNGGGGPTRQHAWRSPTWRLAAR